MERAISLPSKETQFKALKTVVHLGTAAGSLFGVQKALSSQELLDYANHFPAPRVAMAAEGFCDSTLNIQANYFTDHGGQPAESKKTYQQRIDTPGGPIFRQTVDIRAGGPPVRVMTDDEGKVKATVSGKTDGRKTNEGKPGFGADVIIEGEKTEFTVGCDSVTPIQLWKEGSAHSGKEFLRGVDRFFQAITEKVGPVWDGITDMFSDPPTKMPSLWEGSKGALKVAGVALVIVVGGIVIYGLGRRLAHQIGRLIRWII
jgi:hypothetical protein